MIMAYDPRKPYLSGEQYVHNPDYLAPELAERVKKDVRTLCTALGYDINTVEFAIKDGVPYAIDFMNPAPDAELASVGEFYHQWISEAVANLILKRLSEGTQPARYRWDALLSPEPAKVAAVASAKSLVAGEAPMKRCWRWASDKRNLPYLRLLYEAHFIAVRVPGTCERYLNRSSLNWIEFIASRLPESISSAAMATLCGAVFDGLIMELLSTGDLRRTTRALDDFIALLRREHEARTRAARIEERTYKKRKA